MSSANDASRLSFGTIALAAIGSLSLSVAGFFLKAPADGIEANTVRLDSVRTEVGELRGAVTELKGRLDSRLGEDGWTAQDAQAQGAKIEQIIIRIDGHLDMLEERVLYLERQPP